LFVSGPDKDVTVAATGREVETLWVKFDAPDCTDVAFVFGHANPECEVPEADCAIHGSADQVTVVVCEVYAGYRCGVARLAFGFEIIFEVFRFRVQKLIIVSAVLEIVILEIVISVLSRTGFNWLLAHRTLIFLIEIFFFNCRIIFSVGISDCYFFCQIVNLDFSAFQPSGNDFEALGNFYCANLLTRVVKIYSHDIWLVIFINVCSI
jgi:hypothetical protein